MSALGNGGHAAKVTVSNADASTPAALPVKLDHQLCFAVYAASRALTNSYRDLLKKVELTYPQYIVMLALWERDKVTVTELCARVLLDFGTLTPLLKRLESRGLISRKRNARDERQLILKVTTAGRAMQKKAADVPGKLRCQITLSRPQTVELRSAMKQIVLDLGKGQRHGGALHD